MNRQYFLVTIIAMALSVASCAETDTTPPYVVETFPKTGSTEVDHALTEISVIFNEPMTDGNWSWAYTNKDRFPEMAGQPYYMPGLTKNVLPVKLESNKEYEIWINSQKFKNFKDQEGNSATPFRLVFKTK